MVRDSAEPRQKETFPELDKENVTLMNQKMSGLNQRMRAINEVRNQRSTAAGKYEDFTDAEKAERDALKTSLDYVKGLCRQAAEAANITTGVEYGSRQAAGGSVRLDTERPISENQLEAKTHPRVKREMAGLYQQANAELAKYPLYNLDGQEVAQDQ